MRGCNTQNGFFFNESVLKGLRGKMVPKSKKPRLADWAKCLNFLVPMGRIELPTSPLPRECSATELHGPNCTRPFSETTESGDTALA